MTIRFRTIWLLTILTWVLTMAALVFGVEYYRDSSTCRGSGEWCDGRAVDTRVSTLGETKPAAQSSEWIELEATAYHHGCTLPDSGVEVLRPGANGEWPIPNYTIAADKSIPFGTQVLISHGNRVYQMVVGDRGSAIVGARIDLFLESCDQAIRWGRRKVWAQFQ